MSLPMASLAGDVARMFDTRRRAVLTYESSQPEVSPAPVSHMRKEKTMR